MQSTRRVMGHRDSVILKLEGGLGNQLFQWGFAHRLANHYGAKVKLFMDSSQICSVVNFLWKCVV
jgi:hypothetical protein